MIKKRDRGKPTFITAFCLCLIFLFFNGCQKDGPVIPHIIFDTDMGPDFDDAGALALLHALAARGECEILATVSCNRLPSTPRAIEVFNRYFGKPDIPVGVPDGDAPEIDHKNHWSDSLVCKFLKDKKETSDYPSSTRVYRKVLAAQPDRSVTIVTVGFMSNLEDLLKSEGDESSELNGYELVKKKVVNYVTMAGSFPEGSEFNVNMHPSASSYVFEHWPGPVLFSGFEIGVKIRTGGPLILQGADDNPVAWTYRYCLGFEQGKPVKEHASWDLTAVLTAVRNPENYFYRIPGGKFVVLPDGSNRWDSESNADHSFLVHKYPFKKCADIMNNLIMYEPE